MEKENYIMAEKKMKKLSKEALKKVSGGKIEGEIVCSVEPDRCLLCGACVDACPVFAVYPNDYAYYINPAECYGCRACESVCPTGAIFTVFN